jgi:hypothetical protein
MCCALTCAASLNIELAEAIGAGSSSRDKYAPPVGHTYELRDLDRRPGPVNNARNREMYQVKQPPFRERAPIRARGPPPPLEELEVMVIEGGNHCGTPAPHNVLH